jgi:hypothetical protein
MWRPRIRLIKKRTGAILADFVFEKTNCGLVKIFGTEAQSYLTITCAYFMLVSDEATASQNFGKDKELNKCL